MPPQTLDELLLRCARGIASLSEGDDLIKRVEALRDSANTAVSILGQTRSEATLGQAASVLKNGLRKSQGMP